jgi:long-chain acyl-CoA synthetase
VSAGLLFAGGRASFSALASARLAGHNVRMTTMERSGTPAGIAAERAAIEAEIEGSTLLTAYAQTVAAAGDTVAHRWLEDGQWRSLTYRQVHDQVRDVAVALGVVGLRPGEFAVIWSRNRSEATVADYAVMHAGGVPVFIYTTLSAEQAAYLAGHCEATVAIVEREFLPKLVSVREELPRLRQIIVIDGEADDAIGWPRLLGLGRGEAERAPGLFEQAWRRVAPADLATLIYTSGTTGQPKAVMLTHRNACFYQRASAFRDRGAGPPDCAAGRAAGLGEAARRAEHGTA